MRILSTLILVLCLSACGTWWGTPDEIVVERGDTLYSLSKRYDIQLRDLIDANNLRPPYTLRIGQVLKVPVSNYHVVKKGDTLYSLSRQYGVDVKTLAANNDIEAPYTLIIGQRLAINGRKNGYSAPATNSIKSNNTAPATYRPVVTASSAVPTATSAKANTVKAPTKTSSSTTVSKYRKTKLMTELILKLRSGQP